MGASAGLIPCPFALVVLLGAVAQTQIALGLILIVSFSVGLAATLSVLGVAVVRAKHLGFGRRIPKRVLRVVPALSTAVILGLGITLTARAIPDVV